MKTCKHRNCKGKYHAKGECRKHYDRRYSQSPKYKETKKRYEKSPKGKETRRRYYQSPEVKKARRIYQRKRYQNDPVYREKMKRANRKGGKFKDEN